jgi:hypothetical protein
MQQAVDRRQSKAPPYGRVEYRAFVVPPAAQAWGQRGKDFFGDRAVHMSRLPLWRGVVKRHGAHITSPGLLPWTHCFSARLTNAQLPSEMTNLKGAMRIISRTACNGGEIALTHGNSPISIRILALTARENLPVRSI